MNRTVGPSALATSWRRRAYAGAIFWLLFATTGCGGGAGRDTAAGADDEIALVVGEGIPESASAILERSLSEEIRFAHAEPLFRVQRIPVSEIERAKSRKTVVLLALLTVPGKGALVARDILGDEQISNASSHHGAIAALSDVWRSEQSVVVLAASDAEGILSLVEERVQRIQDVVLGAAKGRAGDRLYQSGEDAEAARRLMSDVGWSVRVPAKGWTLDSSRAAEQMLQLAARSPERAVSVHWVSSDSMTLDADGALSLCDAFGARFTNGSVVDRERSAVSETTLDGIRALCVSGAWRNPRDSSAGGLRSLVFVVPAQARVYLIDCRAAASAGDEKVAMWQLEALANTFRVAPPPR
ncbi:MAG: DUF4837 family protein [bacterium]